ncbi:MAG TPA: iron ABC transporter permease [Pyrinomonadaceae bacterium]|nr:iron ABC transporter permease [Pyrinomonadaceae bacterium]HYV81954.1 iron ABC transporter permease [Pyrinomonadaceae bacterium]
MISNASETIASPARRNRVTLRKTVLACAVLAALLVLAIVLMSLLGSEPLPLRASLCALASFGTSACGLSQDQFDILFQIRLPRILLAAAVGGSLATAGAGYQALLRNPLAEPYLLGISNGAAVGTMIALVFFGAMEWTRPILAFSGALVATFAVYRLARGRAGATPERLILAGVIVTTFLSSVIVFVTVMMDATRIRSFTFWLLGDLSGASKALLPVTIVVAIAGTLALTLNARSLNLLMLGERDAFDLGVEVGRVRIVVFLVASLLVGSSVAASGSVGYVGLVVPHLARLSLGSDNRISIPAAALGGALFVIIADTVARTIIAPRELPVGAITALIGAPLFIYLLRRV